MKKLIISAVLILTSLLGFAQLVQVNEQLPEIGHYKPLSTVRRGDTLDVAWFYKPNPNMDIRVFQVDFQYKTGIMTYISSTVDGSVNGMTPSISYKTWDSYKFNGYLNGTYLYSTNPDYTVGRNYLVLSSGSAIATNGYVIHNKYKINNVIPNYVSDSVTVNWARLFKSDGTSIGDNVAVINYNKMAIKLLGNLTISGKVWLPTSMKTFDVPQIICTEAITGEFISSTNVALDGTYTLVNVDEFKKYKLQLKFVPSDLNNIRDNAVTITDAVKAFDEVTNTSIDQTYSKQYLKNGLGYLISDVNKNGILDGGDPYLIYASVSGLKPIDTSLMVSVFHKEEYDSLALGINQWTTWPSFVNRGNFIYDSVGTSNITVDIKYFILGDNNRSHSSPVYDSKGNLIVANKIIGNLNISIPDTYAGLGQPMYVPFNINTNGLNNSGLQFEMRYDPTVVKFDELVSNIQGPWLQYVTNDEVNGVVRFGGMNNLNTGAINGSTTPFKLKFSPIRNTDITTTLRVRKLMDASQENSDQFNIVLKSEKITLTSRMGTVSTNNEITAVIRPNPTSGFFELVVEFPEKNMDAIAKIYNMQGQLIKEVGKISSDGVYTTAIKQINITNEKNGAYVLTIDNQNKKLTKQFIKA
jgi:hypothetical protein